MGKAERGENYDGEKTPHPGHVIFLYSYFLLLFIVIVFCFSLLLLAM